MSESTKDPVELLAELLEENVQRRSGMQKNQGLAPRDKELGDLLTVAESFEAAPEARPSRAFRHQARARLMARLEASADENVTFFDRIRHSVSNLRGFGSKRRVSMGWIVVVATAVSLLMGGGAAYAADGAIPGDALYGLDLSLEQLQLQLTSDAQARIILQLENASERLEEAEALLAGGESDLVPEAVEAYGRDVSDIARNLPSVGGVDRDKLSVLLEHAFSIHDAKLAGLLDASESDDTQDLAEEPIDDGDDGDDADGDERCATWEDHPVHETHPIAARIADLSEVESDDLMIMFCEDDGMGWGQIMQELGLIGRPEGVPPGPPPYPGPPDHAGRPDHAGPPAGVPPGPPHDVPPGPPDHAGPPDDVPHGPPSHANPSGNGGPPDHAGPPDDVPKGPPAGVPKGPPGHGG